MVYASNALRLFTLALCKFFAYLVTYSPWYWECWTDS